MKALFLLLFLSAPTGFAQSFRFGVEGGVPLTSAFDTGTSSVVSGLVLGLPASTSYSSITKRYTLGGTAELDLPFHLAVKADLLYKRLGFNSDSSAVVPAGGGVLTATSATTANSWEFPLLGKYSVSKLGPLQPYVEGGIAFRTLQGVQQTTAELCPDCLLPVNQTTQTNSPAELSHRFNKGFAAGAGLEFRHLLVGVFGEIRYTRWTADAFSAPDGLLNSTRNQADLLVGVTF
jgi:opacity protein-like surface antigen